MELTINGKPERVDDAVRTIADLLRARRANSGAAGAPAPGVDAPSLAPCAVEIDGRLAPRREWETTALAPGAAIEIVTLVGGG